MEIMKMTYSNRMMKTCNNAVPMTHENASMNSFITPPLRKSLKIN